MTPIAFFGWLAVAVVIATLAWAAWQVGHHTFERSPLDELRVLAAEIIYQKLAPLFPKESPEYQDFLLLSAVYVSKQALRHVHGYDDRKELLKSIEILACEVVKQK